MDYENKIYVEVLGLEEVLLIKKIVECINNK